MIEDDQFDGSEPETSDASLARRAERALKGLLPTRRNETEWPWGRLRHDTAWRPLRLDDVEGAHGVEGCYDASMIPDEFILHLAGETAERVRTLIPESTGDAAYGKRIEEQRGGMLHPFRQPPVFYYATNKKTESVYESMMRQLEQTQKAVADGRCEGVTPSLYEGAVLVPKGEPDRILAWMTWWRSQQTDPQFRTQKNDQLVMEVRKLFEEPPLEEKRAREDIKLHAGLQPGSYKKKVPTTLLFDTVNAREPGAASILFDHFVPAWREAGYDRILTYRHKILEVLCRGPLLSQPSQTPRGDNEASGRFFSKRLITEIGTRVNHYLAVRRIGGQEYRVASTEGWMYGDLEEVQKASHDLVQARTK